MKKAKEFNFSKLPSVVMEKISGQMEPSEIIDLSMCSKKTSNAIKRSRCPPINLRVVIKNDEMSLGVYQKDTEERSANFRFTDVKNIGINTVIKMNGLEIKTRHPKRQLNKTDYTCVGSRIKLDTTMHAVINYIMQLYHRRCFVESIHVDFKDLGDNFNSRNALRSISTVEVLYIGSPCFNRSVEYLLSDIEVTKTFYSSSNTFCGQKPFGKLRCTDEITCFNASWMLGGSLLNLNCKYVDLRNARFTADEVMAFLKKWKASSGEEMKKIRFFYISLEFDVELDMSELSAQPWNPNKRVRTFHLRYGYKDQRAVTMCCKDAMDIERSDGLLASITHYTNGKIYFCVWPEPNAAIQDRIN